jgi:hypothetical protein
MPLCLARWLMKQDSQSAFGCQWLAGACWSAAKPLFEAPFNLFAEIPPRNQLNRVIPVPQRASYRATYLSRCFRRQAKVERERIRGRTSAGLRRMVVNRKQLGALEIEGAPQRSLLVKGDEHPRSSACVMKNPILDPRGTHP